MSTLSRPPSEQRWQLVLASASRTRSALLAQAGIEHSVQTSAVDESQGTAATPQALVSLLADAKERAGARRSTDAIVLGCDSVLGVDGRVLGKPATAEAALEHWG